MDEAWVQEFESLEAISQQDDIRALCLRMAAMAHEGRLDRFVHDVERSTELDEETKGTVSELAGCPSFLQAVEDYVGRTRILH